nr:hypothetical protein [Pseudomonas oleovorans]
MWYERGWIWAKEHLTITVPGVVSIFAATYFVMLAVNAGEVGAAWVQAVGSILALVGAIYLPIIHSKQLEKQREEQSLGQLRVLVEDCYEKLWALTNCFIFPEKERRQMTLYLHYGRTAEWAHLEMAVNQYPLELVPADHLSTLVVLRQAVSQALSISNQLPKWKEDASNPEVIDTLKGRRDLLSLKKASLPWPKGLREQQDRYHQDRGARLEKGVNQPAMRERFGYKVYIRWPVPDPDGCTSSAYYVIIPPDNGEEILTGYVESDNYPEWTSRDSATPIIWRLACHRIDEHIEDAL